MIIQETLEDGSIRTYSDRGVLIHGGFPEGDYAEAIDPAEMGRIYTETDIPIEEPYDSVDEEYAAAGRIMMGADTDEHN